MGCLPCSALSYCPRLDTSVFIHSDCGGFFLSVTGGCHQSRCRSPLSLILQRQTQTKTPLESPATAPKFWRCRERQKYSYKLQLKTIHKGLVDSGKRIVRRDSVGEMWIPLMTGWVDFLVTDCLVDVLFLKLK